MLGQAYDRSGYKGCLLQRIGSLEHASSSDPLRDLYVAHLYAVLNDQANALRYLERSYGQRNPWLLDVPVDPAMDRLRSSPGFRDLVRRIGVPPL